MPGKMTNLNTITHISIDASTKCQLSCPVCSTSKGFIKKSIIGEGFLSLRDFQSIIGKYDQIRKIELSNWGEIFLNPEINEIIKCAYEKKIGLTAGNGTNFNSVSPETINYLVKYKFKYLTISIDGASQDTYVKYRRNGNFDNVIDNIRQINHYKIRYNSVYPILGWQYILFGHNENEISVAKKICEELNMKFIPKLNHSENYSPIVNPDKVIADSGILASSRKDYKRRSGKFYKRSCCQLWHSPQINWDGELLGCCVNKWKGFGNVFKLGLFPCLESPLFVQTKLALQWKRKIFVHPQGRYFDFCRRFSKIQYGH